ncbi:MAG: helical backbone metal receptor [Polyangiaceae bacterium]
MSPTSRRAFLLLAAASVAACRSGARASKEGRAQRVVGVSPSMTETAFAIGAGDRLVGRTTFCDYPEAAKKLPTIGGFTDASLEAIVALEPTLVIGERRPGGRDLDQSLRDRGIDTFFPPMYDVAQIRDMITALATKLDAAARAAEVVRELDGKLDAVRARVATRPRPKTLFLFDFHPLVGAGPGAFPNELLGIAGGANAVTTGGEYPELSPEGVLSLDPDVVIDGSAGAYADPPEVLLAAAPGLASLRALKSHRVARLATNAALRPGPRIGDGVAELAGIIHPEKDG